MKVFTIVKGEVDIVEDWVIYHGHLFGFENIFVIDNLSLDGTYEKLLHLKQKYGINITRLNDYKKKGEYMTNLLRTFSKNEFGFPIDIDEFIVYYDKQNNTISCDKSKILNYIVNLRMNFPKKGIFKMNYIQSKIFNEEGYERAAVDCKYGEYDDRGNHAKTFFYSRNFNGTIDHGNHYPCNDYVLTRLCLIHFHERNLEQMKKKIYNNIKGLGYPPFNLAVLKSYEGDRSKAGFHHITNQVAVLENRYNIGKSLKNENDISLEPLNSLIKLINQ
jgi:hypothetical protein